MNTGPIVTRFAPSPTGYLHIGGARTALFNWLYARHHGGRFTLRIEDTDRKRSTDDAIAKIFEGLGWLGLDHDGDAVFQSQNAARHVEMVEQMLADGTAYRCYCTQEELTTMREAARAEGRTRLYDRVWRERDPADAPSDVPPVVRVKMPLPEENGGETVIRDAVQGEVRVANDALDDFILLRADGTPTYMLAVVVDDHDMGVTHVVRGDDHLNNAFRQYHLYKACGWDAPEFAHIPLIHGSDGAKLSKRHGALGVEAYRDMGILPEAMRNYLLRLGWSHGDDEIISTEQAVAWFDFDAVGKSPARFDMDKLENLNGHYIREGDDNRLIELILPAIANALGHEPDDAARARLQRGLAGLKPRAKTLPELAASAVFYCRSSSAGPLAMEDKAAKLLDTDARARMGALADALDTQDSWDEAPLEAAVRTFAEAQDIKLGAVAQPLRAALTGSATSPGIFEVLAALGRDEALARIRAVSA